MTRPAFFGKRAEPHTIVIARGNQIRHFTVRPWTAALAGAVCLSMVLGYLVATGYLILRDDALKAALMRQAHLQHAYEDRIATLRAQVDKITSHQLLDQQFIETRIAEITSRQSTLAQRSGDMLPLVERARETGLGGGAFNAGSLPVPQPRPEQAGLRLNRADAGSQASPIRRAAPRGTRPVEAAAPAHGLARLGQVDTTLSRMESRQLVQLTGLIEAAHSRRNAMIETARSSGLKIASQPVALADAVGGPFVPVDEETMTHEAFISGLTSLREALDALDRTRGEIAELPVAHPAPGRAVTSGFGQRRDPILGRTAFHAGIDFRTPTGTPISAPAHGTVVKAGRHGGYGKMVELRHANGLTTRFAHLSRIGVKIGARVHRGQVIGRSGNTGRSTGPHLHYEIRSGGEAVNPMRYLQAGAKLDGYL